METAEFTVMCLIEDPDTGRVLAQRRVKGWPGVAFPGGHVETGESFVDAAVREVREETGLIVGNLSLCGVKNWYTPETGRRYVVFLFRTSAYTGTLAASEEGEVFWAEPGQLPSMDLAGGFERTLEVFFRGDLAEEFHIPGDDEWVCCLK